MRRRRDRMSRGLVTAAAVAALAVVLPTVAAADPVDDQRALVARVTDRLEALERQAGALGEDYVATVGEQHRLDAEVTAFQRRVAAQEAAVGALRAELSEVAVQAYMGAGTSGVSPIFDTTAGVTDGLARDHLARVATNSGAATTDEYEQALADLHDEQAGLDAARSRAAAEATELAADKRATERHAAEYAGARAAAEAKLGDLVRQEEERRARESYLRVQRQAEQAAATQRAAAEAAAARRQAATAPRAIAAPTTQPQQPQQQAPPRPVASVRPAPSATTPVTTAPAAPVRRRAAAPATTAPRRAPASPATTAPRRAPTSPATTAPRRAPATPDREPVTRRPPPATTAPPPAPRPPVPPAPPKPAVPAPSSRASIAINAALSQLGVPYRFAAASPGVAFDCSGLTSWAWAQAGVSLPHQSRAQYGVVNHVPKGEAQPGDLLFFYSPISHVSIYLGGGRHVHAPTLRLGGDHRLRELEQRRRRRPPGLRTDVIRILAGGTGPVTAPAAGDDLPAPSTVAPMKVGVLQFFSWPERRVPLEQVYARALQRIEVMDRSGYDAVWLAEHHFTTYSVCPSVHLMALEAAHRTRTCASARRCRSPRCTTRCASPRRSRSSTSSPAAASTGAPAAASSCPSSPPSACRSTRPRRASARPSRSCWRRGRNERLTFHGKYWDFDDVEVLPKPFQQPHPPTWVAATSPDAIGWAASMGHPILMDPHASFAEIGAKYDHYVGEMAANGFAAPEDTPMARLVAVAATDEEAEQIARNGAAWTIGAYAHGAGATSMGHDPDGEVAERIEGYVRDRIIWGSPARVRDELARLRRGDAAALPDDRPAVARVVRALHGRGARRTSDADVKVRRDRRRRPRRRWSGSSRTP